MPATASLESAPHAVRRGPAAATFTRTGPPPSPARITGGGLRVLLVDDDLVNQLFGKVMIEKMGFRAAIASDGAHAVARWKTESFDLVLMDCWMPVMDGFAAARRIREGEAQRGLGIHTPIVALTACIDGREREDCISAGMDAVLHKPFNPDELLAFVDAWARTMPGSRAAASTSTPGSGYAVGQAAIACSAMRRRRSRDAPSQASTDMPWTTAL